jgi:transposase
MWTEITRRKYEREGQRYASDVTDAEWALIDSHMPAAKPLGRPREIELRAVLDAILYIARTKMRAAREDRVSLNWSWETIRADIAAQAECGSPTQIADR